MLFYRAALPLSRQTLTFVSNLVRAHRREVGTVWRKLNPGQQALLVLVYLRKGEPFAEVGAGSTSRPRHAGGMPTKRSTCLHSGHRNCGPRSGRRSGRAWPM